MKGSFQIIVIASFIGLAVLGVLVFSGAIPLGKSNEPGALGTVVIWGTVNAGIMNPLLEEFNEINKSFVVKYEQKSSANLDQNILEALASGVGPDILLMPDDLTYHYANRIFTIPYGSFPLASFKNAYASAGEVFLNNNGVMALPLYIDPLVMYYNRTILDANGVVYPPAYWDEFEKFVSTFTKKDDTNKITKSAVAMGHFSNVNNAKSILSALFMQTGNPIISIKNGSLTSDLDSNNLGSVLRFFTNFADPNKTVYSWNKSFANSRDAFSREDLAIYFGFASELPLLVNKNPNQNFSISHLPQIRNSNLKLTKGRVTGLSVLSSSKNFDTAFTAINLLASSDFVSKLSLALGVAPARRDLLQTKPNDAFSPIFYDASLYAKSFLDPSPKESEDIFRLMVDKVISNTLSPEDAVSDANSKMGLLLLR
jgi:ABC-type glycerol-3-phosphate transport system substrate-binding protein